MRAAAEAVIAHTTLAEELQASGHRRAAATLRWKAARRALMAMAAARSVLGLPSREQTAAMTALTREAFLQ
jgi:hypothetical protein